jgi:hypothetical protein
MYVSVCTRCVVSWEMPMPLYCWLYKLSQELSESVTTDILWAVECFYRPRQNSSQHTDLYIHGLKFESSNLLNPNQSLSFIMEILKFYSSNSQQVYIGIYRIWVLKSFHGDIYVFRSGKQLLPFVIDSRLKRKVWFYQLVAFCRTRISTALNELGRNGDTCAYIC